MKFNIILIPLILVGFNACNLLNQTEAPQVSQIYTTAEDFIVNPGDTILFWVNVSDPQDKKLTITWTLSVGEIIGSAQRDTLRWKAPLTGGRFMVKVKVANPDTSVTKSEYITVVSFIRPYVKIIVPTVNDYLVQYQSTTITAQAFHDNGLSLVQLWINDSLIDSQSGGNDNQYRLDWDGNGPAGLIKIKVSAVSRITAMSGADSIFVPLEGIVRGKK